MYHVALGVSPDDEQLRDKIAAVVDLPQAKETVRVTLVHRHDGDGPIADVPVVAEGLEMLEGAGLEADVYDPGEARPSGGLIEATDELDVDLLCIGGRRRSPAGKLQMKTGAQKAILQAECPVLVAGELESREPRTD